LAGKSVVVVGGGQSAVECAALLHEAGARVELISRRPITWWPPDRIEQRRFYEGLLAPRASLAPGWRNWALDHLPYLFYRFAQPLKDRYLGNYRSGATDWLRARVIGKVRLHEGCSVARVRSDDTQVALSLSDGRTVRADHVLLATGFQADLGRLSFLDPRLLAMVRCDGGAPCLGPSFESSVPGLYFIGFASVRAFGPLYRHVAGAGPAARRVTRSVVRALGERPRSVMTPPELAGAV
jgi:cation diffusion facilitator CzcD-associated flavoprotein CzcO